MARLAQPRKQHLLEEGVFKQYKPAAVFGTHVLPGTSGQIFYRSGPTLASGDAFSIRVRGKQDHGGMPWNTIDPVVTSALIITGLQTVVSRRANLITSPAAVTVGMIHGGDSGNVVLELVEMEGTLRSYDESVRTLLKQEVPLVVQKIAESTHAKAEVKIVGSYDVTLNYEALARQMVQYYAGPPMATSKNRHGKALLRTSRTTRKLPPAYSSLWTSRPQAKTRPRRPLIIILASSWMKRLW